MTETANETSMLTWLTEAIANITDFTDAKRDIDENETEVGVLDDEQKRLYTLRRTVLDEIEETTRRHFQDLRAGMDPFDRDELMRVITDEGLKRFKEVAKASHTATAVLSLRADALKDLLWASIRSMPDMAGRGSLGICKGFKIVESEEEECPDCPLHGAGGPIIRSLGTFLVPMSGIFGPGGPFSGPGSDEPS